MLIGGERAGVSLRAACVSPADATLVSAIDRALRLDAPDALRYDDPKRSVGRRIRLDQGRLRAVRLAGDVAGDAWLRDWLTTNEDVSSMRAALMLPASQPPRGFRARGRIVCSCHAVAEPDITAMIAASAGPPYAILAPLQDALKCGANCGSCVPELKQMIAIQVASGAPAMAA